MLHIHDISKIAIDIDALDAVPESIARECCILPVKLGESTLHIVHPIDVDPSNTIAKLEFILNRSITLDTGDRHMIETAINCHYPTARQEAEKCNLPDALPTFDRETDFAFLDLIGKKEFATSSSVSFRLGKNDDSIEYSRRNTTLRWK